MKSLSLIQRLWLLLLLLVFLSLSGALLANLYNARDYLEQQLSSQNVNAANSLALLITQNRAEASMAETLINAAFDQGHFRRIRWQGVDGKAKVARVNDAGLSRAPRWFQQLLPLSPAAGKALVTAGWLQAGEIQVEAEPGYAYDSLWRGAWHTLWSLLAAGLLAGLLGSIDIFKLRRDLAQVVRQAHAISERRFLQIQEPRVPELAAVARAMNQMVARLQAYLQGLSDEVEQLRRERHTDAVTGLASREALELALGSLQAEDDDVRGFLLLARLTGLAELNQRLGGERADQILRQLAQDLESEASRRKGGMAARLRGADFALLCPELDAEEARALAEALCRKLARYPQMGLSDQGAVGHIGVCAFASEDALPALLSRASQALAQAEAAGDNQWRFDDGAESGLNSERDWRDLIMKSCERRELQLRWYPVKNGQGELWRYEAMLFRPEQDGQPAINALRLVSHSLRLNLSQLLDLEALRLALASAPSDWVAVNLSPASLGDPAFRERAMGLLHGSRVTVTFEFDETGLAEHWDAFLAFGEAARRGGHHLAVELRGHRLELVASLGQAGIEYLMLDGLLTRGVAEDQGRQALVKGLQRMTSLMSIRLEAKGVANQADVDKLIELGIGGLTGPAIG